MRSRGIQEVWYLITAWLGCGLVVAEYARRRRRTPVATLVAASGPVGRSAPAIAGVRQAVAERFYQPRHRAV
jgi:hypothetical protein